MSEADINSTHNEHADPDGDAGPIYPRLSEHDPAYSVGEAALRSALFIPAGFGFGRDGRTPVLLVAGTGSLGGENFGDNYGRLLAASACADPVWLNVPGRMCAAAARNAEYVAYAIHYLSARCRGQSVAALGWSQGNVLIQWALKYWPSTRARVSNFIALSADFRGTALTAALLPLGRGAQPAAPAIWNQTMDSAFIRALRADGGDSAYVPTTSIYSAVDEAVQPQWGEGASARMNDERNVGVTNCQLWGTPALWKPAGFAYSHDGVLFSPLAWALTEDALTNGGPARLDRIANLDALSWHRKAPGLTLLDAARTRVVSLWCLFNIMRFVPKVWDEPALPLYATATPHDNDNAESGQPAADDVPVSGAFETSKL